VSIGGSQPHSAPASQAASVRQGRQSDVAAIVGASSVGQAAVRIGLRTLAVAGFAGAAWLLSASAAQAAAEHRAQASGQSPVAETAPAAAPSDPSGAGLLGNGPHGGENSSATTGANSVTDTLGTATKPVVGLASALLHPVVAGADPATSVVLPSAAPAGTSAMSTANSVTSPAGQKANSHPITTGSTTSWPTTVNPDRTGAPMAATGGAGIATKAGAAAAATNRGSAARSGIGTGTGGNAGTSGLIGVVQGLTAPLGLARVAAAPLGLVAPLTKVIDPVVAPLTQVLRPVTDALRSAVAPVTTALDTVIRPATHVGSRSRGSTPGSPVTSAPDSRPTATPVRSGPATALDADPNGMDVAGTSTTNSEARQLATTEFRTTAIGAAVQPGTNDLPNRPFPAPLRGYLGAGTGASTTGAGSHQDGGGFALVPSSVAGSMVASHRLPVPTDVEVLRLEAAAPTVSPD
jgi:hypothetical protein